MVSDPRGRRIYNFEAWALAVILAPLEIQLLFRAAAFTWRHLLVNYINAFGALVLGYRHLHFIDEGIAAVKRKVRSSSR